MDALRTSSTLAGRLLLAAGLALCGCASTTPDPSIVLTEPPAPSLIDRVLRRDDASKYRRPVEESPRDPSDPGRLSLAYARLMEQAGRLEQAETHYTRVLDENPGSVDALVGLARVHTLAGRHAQAEQSLLKALKEQPKSPEVLHALAQSYAARELWAEAQQVLQQAALEAPADDSIQYDLAVALVQLGQVDAAIPIFAGTVGEAEAHYNAGLILHRCGRLPESQQQFQLALAMRPDLEQARYWLAASQQQQMLPPTPPGASPTAIQTVGYDASGPLPLPQISGAPRPPVY
jgi:tetratricopeptide (TPR) repeat protein